MFLRYDYLIAKSKWLQDMRAWEAAHSNGHFCSPADDLARKTPLVSSQSPLNNGVRQVDDEGVELYNALVVEVLSSHLICRAEFNT